MADLEKLAEELSSLTVMEAADLAKVLEEKWGVSGCSHGGCNACCRWRRRRSRWC